LLFVVEKRFRNLKRLLYKLCHCYSGQSEESVMALMVLALQKMFPAGRNDKNGHRGAFATGSRKAQKSGLFAN